MTVLSDFRVHQERRNLAPGTIYKRTLCVRALARWVEPEPVTEATRADIEKLLDSRKVCARSRAHWISHLHAFFDWAVREGMASSDPTVGIARPRLRRLLPRPISDADLRTAIDAADGRMAAWLVLGAYAGMRCSEIAHLQRDDIHEADGLIRIVGKGGAERVVPMHPSVVGVLRRAGMPTRGHVFRRPSGQPYSPSLVSKEIATFLDHLGIDATAHQLRHWFGSRAYQASRDIRAVQELLGHQSPTTTAGYTAFAPGAKADAVNALPALA